MPKLRDKLLSLRLLSTFKFPFESIYLWVGFVGFIFKEAEKGSFFWWIMISFWLCLPYAQLIIFSFFISQLRFPHWLCSGEKISRKLMPIYFYRNTSAMMMLHMTFLLKTINNIWEFRLEFEFGDKRFAHFLNNYIIRSICLCTFGNHTFN